MSNAHRDWQADEIDELRRELSAAQHEIRALKRSIWQVWRENWRQRIVHTRAMVIDIIGREKILFGSDYPLIKPARYFKELRNAGLTDDELADICGGNAVQLLG